jgi:hypothetical protein
VSISSAGIFNRVFRGSRSIALPLNGPKEIQLNMSILSTSEKVMEADTLLNKASLKVEEFRGTLDQDSYEMAQGWLER